MLDFLDFSILDALDILLVAILIYYTYKLLKGTVAINIFLGIAFIFLIWKITQILKMEMLSNILGYLLSGGVIALIIVFQQEIRKFLLMIGTTNVASRTNFLRQLKFLKSEIALETNVETLLNACKKMSKSNTGALIVIERTNSLDFLITTGDRMNAEMNQVLLESIFYKNSPLHDGAVIIEGNYITGSRIILPVSENENINSRLGLRHRAAIGITEKTDAIAIVISEENGKLSLVKNGELKQIKSIESFKSKLEEELG